MENPDRCETDTPTDQLPPGTAVFLCPSCECPLQYTYSRGEAPGDVSDYYRCPGGCGTFEHERPTRRLRIVGAGYLPRRNAA
jgi:hypothetical protein